MRVTPAALAGIVPFGAMPTYVPSGCWLTSTYCGPPTGFVTLPLAQVTSDVAPYCDRMARMALTTSPSA